MFHSKRSYWRKLDNAAKLFPATSNKKDTRVFRFYCIMKEDVREEILQQAVEKALEKYPLFLSVMRKGLFWHCLEKSNLKPVVTEEFKEPCSNLYVRDKKSLLFEVTYYKRRINFEVFHVLTDGTGATCFLKEIVKHYIVLAYGEADISLDKEHITIQDQESDSFRKYYSDLRREKKEKVKAYQIKTLRKARGPLQVTEAVLSVKEVLAKAREYQVSMTVFLTAVFLCAIHREMPKRQEKHPVVLMVPVNLRNFFPSDSMLNFFGYIEPGYRFREGDTFEQVLAQVKTYFQEELTKERLSMRMNELIALEMNPILRVAPLELKNLGILAGAKMAASDVTAIFSNMSVVRMPEAYVPYIERFGVYTSTPKTELCMCSFEDKLSLGFTSRYDSMNIKRNFFQILSELGIHSKVEEPDYPEERLASAAAVKFFEWFSFACIVFAVIAAVVNITLTPGKYWAIIVSGGILSMWTALAIGFVKRYNLLKNAMWQLILITVGCLIWDLGTGWHKWSIDFVFPGISVIIMMSMLMITKLQRLAANEYMIYFVMAAGYGFVIPLILLLTGVLGVTFPSVICVGFSFLFFMAQVIFKRRELGEELNKKFHI